MNEDKATRYQRLKRQAGIASLGWTIVLLLGLLLSRLSLTLRATADALAASAGATGAWHASTTVVFYVGLLSLLNEIGGLPVAFYSGYFLEKRYGLSVDRVSGWAVDQVKAFAVGVVIGGAAVSMIYFCIRQSPEHWWALAGGGFCVLSVGLVNLAPVVLLPLFYRVKPLERESLRGRLLALAERAGTRVLGAYEWGVGDKSRKANAALVGLGTTRRILVSDTMLAEYTDEEIEVVLAHELAHHLHGDIWRGLLFEAGLIMAGFYLAARALGASLDATGLQGVGDVAGLPLLLLAGGAVSLAMRPVAHAMSRAHERNADRFAVNLTKNPVAFISAMRRLAAQNLAEEHPSQVVQWLFYSHPPIRERIAAAETFGQL
jgi:STE24 endopeptidase